MRSTRQLCMAAIAGFVALTSALAGCSGDAATDRAGGKPSPSVKATANPFGSPSARPSASPPPALPTAKPKYVVTTCRVEGLSMRLGTFTDRADETSVNLYIKNKGATTCTISGYGSLALFSDDGSEIATVLVEETSPAPATVSIKPGREAVQRLRWSTKPAADEPQNGPCNALAVVLSVRLTEPSVAVDLYTKSSSRPDGLGAVCNSGRLLHTAWRAA